VHTEFWGINFLEIGHLEDREGEGRIKMRWIWCMMANGWNWLGIMSSGRLWY